MASPGDAFDDTDAGFRKPFHVLLHDNRVGASRKRGPREDANGLAGADHAGKAVAGGGLSDDLQVAWDLPDVGMTNRIAVHRGSREGWLGPLRREGARKHPTPGFPQGHHADVVQRRDAGQEAIERSLNRQQRHQPASLVALSRCQSPDLPPVLDRSLMPVISMPLSAALAMS